MDYTKKMMLVPAGRPDPTINKLSELDKQMSSVLKNNKLSSLEKIRFYNQILRRNLDMENRFKNEKKEQASTEIEYTYDPSNIRAHTKSDYAESHQSSNDHDTASEYLDISNLYDEIKNEPIIKAYSTPDKNSSATVNNQQTSNNQQETNLLRQEATNITPVVKITKTKKKFPGDVTQSNILGQTGEWSRIKLRKLAKKSKLKTPTKIFRQIAYKPKSTKK